MQDIFGPQPKVSQKADKSKWKRKNPKVENPKPNKKNEKEMDHKNTIMKKKGGKEQGLAIRKEKLRIYEDEELDGIIGIDKGR